ncbi:MAG: hypothetical protein ABW221_27580, partial [Vicinamibacteria bacterium]
MRIPKRLTFVLLVSVSCGGSSEPDRPAAPASSAVSGPTGLYRTANDGVPVELPAFCAVGTGDPRAHCDQGGAAALWPAVDAAIDELVAKRPALFNLERVAGPKGYYVLAHDEFYLGVAAILQTKGICAQYDFRVLQVKDGQARSEQYDLLQPNGHIRRGPAALAATCAPASFPLDPAVVIDRVRVAFYAIQCEDGRTPPRNGEGILPTDCSGYVTATPKKADDTDVHKSVHGPDIV